MLDKNEDAAISLVKQGILAMSVTELDNRVADTQIAEILGVRHANSLAELKIHTIGDILRADMASCLIEARSFKELSLLRVLQKLLKHVVCLCIKLESR